MIKEINSMLESVRKTPLSSTAQLSTITKLQDIRTGIDEKQSSIKHMLNEKTIHKKEGRKLSGLLDRLP